MLFTSKHKSQFMDKVSVQVANVRTISKICVRNLGVMFDSNMIMTQQVASICRSGYAQLRSIGLIRRYLSNDATKSLVHGFVMSRLDYCNSLIHGLPYTMISKLQRVHNMAARTARHNYITPILKKLHWLPVKYRAQFKLLVHTHKALHDQSPVYLRDMLQMYTSGRTLRSQNTELLVIPKIRTTAYGNRCFTYVATSLWNGLLADIRKSKITETFKKRLKAHYFLVHCSH